MYLSLSWILPPFLNISKIDFLDSFNDVCDLYYEPHTSLNEWT